MSTMVPDSKLFLCHSALVQLLNAIMNEEYNAKAQVSAQVSVPEGLKSTNWNTKVRLNIRNNRDQMVRFWWVNYNGNAVLYGAIPPQGGIEQLTYGTHPWLITEANGDLISVIVPHTSNMQITLE